MNEAISTPGAATGETATPPAATRLRGTVIKLPDATPGLLVVAGAQKPFVLEGVWRAAVAPNPGMQVDVELGPHGEVAAIFALEAQTLMREHGEQVAALARQGFGNAVARLGKLTLAALAALWLGWFVAPTVRFGPLSLTLWDVLGIDTSNLMSLMAGTSNHGLFALLGVLAVVAPLGVMYFRAPRAAWLNAAPLGFLLLLFVRVAWQLHGAMSAAEDASNALGLGTAALAGVSEASSNALWSTVTQALSFGLPLVLLASGTLFVQALRAKPPLPAGLGSAIASAGAALHGSAGVAATRLTPKRLRLLGLAAAAGVVLAGATALALKLLKSPEERAVEAFEEIAAAADKNQGDCPAAGAAVGQALESHREDAKALLPLMLGQSGELRQRYGQRLEAAATRLTSVSMRCAFDGRYSAALFSAMGSLRTASLETQERAKPAEAAATGASLTSLDALRDLLPGATTATPAAQPPPEPRPAPARNVALPTPTVTAAPAPAPVTPPTATTAAAPAPKPAPVPIMTTFAVFGVAAGDALNVRASAEPSAPVLATFAPAATGLHSTGHVATHGAATWLELIVNGGTGWVNRDLLVEEHPDACGDARLTATLDRFSRALATRDGAGLRAVTSPQHGLSVRTELTNPSVRFEPNAVAELFASTTPSRFASSGPGAEGTFRDVVLPAYQRSLASSPASTCGRIVLPPADARPAVWPVELRALVPLSLTPAKAGASGWVLGVEYVDGAPFVAALVEYPSTTAPPPVPKPRDAAPEPPAPDVKDKKTDAKAAKPEPAKPEPEKKADKPKKEKKHH